jgi:hypothetical protein
MSATSGNPDLSAKFQQAMTNLTVSDVSKTSFHEQLAAATEPLDLKLFIGTIGNVGQVASGDRAVQFIDPDANLGYVSVWPDWAADLAQAALLAGKRVLVNSYGTPEGPNLLGVFILAY